MSQADIETDPVVWIETLRESQRDLAETVRSLKTEQLYTPSYCSDWTIAQVLAHIGSGAEVGLHMINAALDGRDLPSKDEIKGIWELWDARTPEQQRSFCLAYDKDHVDRLESVSLEDLQRVKIPAAALEVSGTELVRLRLSEHALHTWDVQVALDPTAEVQQSAVALLVRLLPQMVPRVGKPKGLSFRVLVRAWQPPMEHALEVSKKEVKLVPWTEDHKGDGTLNIPSEAFLRLVFGRMDANHTPTLSMDSGRIVLDDLRRAFPGV